MSISFIKSYYAFLIFFFLNYSLIFFSDSFGNTVPENSTFANLASQSTVGFGSLAQSQGAAQPPQVPQFSGYVYFKFYIKFLLSSVH